MSDRARRWVRPAIVSLVFLVGLWTASVDLVNIAIYLPWAIVGAILAIRRPGNSVGPLLMAFAIAWTLTTDPTTPIDDLRAGRYPLAVGIRLVASETIGFAGYALLFLLTVVFPDGRLPADRRRWAVLAVVVTGCALSVLAMFVPVIGIDTEGADAIPVPNPIGFPPIGELMGPLVAGGTPFLALVGALAVGVVSMVVRRRRAHGARRQQFTWVVAAFGAVACAVIFAFVTFGIGEAIGTTPPDLVWLPALLSYPLPPLAIGIAVLRYRLYEIDRLVSRSIGYSLATVGLLASFAVLTVALQSLLAPILQGRVLAVAASTLIVFALFQPIHRRIQRVVDRHFDRARYDADLAATAFARGVRDETDLVRVEGRLVDAVDRTLAPTSRTLWVRDRRGARPDTTFADPASATGS